MSDRNDTARPLGRTNLSIQRERAAVPWLWEGVLAEEAVTLLSAPEKIGKTTLLSLLLDRRRAGGQLLGRTVLPGKTILCSEEHLDLWAWRQPPLDFGPDLLFHQPRGDCPTRRAWRRFIDELLDLPDASFNLLVIDTAATFIPLAQRNKRVLQWALAQLRLVTGLFAGVLLVNQSRNMHRPLAAFADIVLEMAMPRHDQPLAPPRQRIFTAVGRYPNTLQSTVAELNADGTDYVPITASPSPAPPPLLTTLQELLRSSPTPLTRQELLARWPAAPPRGDTLWRTLARACELGLFVQSGAGTKNDAFRYALAAAAQPLPRDG